MEKTRAYKNINPTPNLVFLILYLVVMNGISVSRTWLGANNHNPSLLLVLLCLFESQLPF